MFSICGEKSTGKGSLGVAPENPLERINLPGMVRESHAVCVRNQGSPVKGDTAALSLVMGLWVCWLFLVAIFRSLPSISCPTPCLGVMSVLVRHGQLLPPANPPRVSLPQWVFLAGATSRARGLLSAEWWLSVPWHCPFQHVLCKVAALVCVKEEEGVWGLCGLGRRGHTSLPRTRTFCWRGAQGRGVPGRRGAVAQRRRSRFGQEEPLAAAGTLCFSVPESV